MKLNQTIWEVMALFPWMVIFSAIVVDTTLGLPLLVDLSLPGIIIYILIAAALLAIWIIFIVHAWKNGRAEWAISIFFLGIFAYPVYWWKYVRTLPSQLHESSTSFDK